VKTSRRRVERVWIGLNTRRPATVCCIGTPPLCMTAEKYHK
jgi:hypothetical protein